MNSNFDEHFIKQNKFSGCVLVSMGNEMIFHNAYGCANLEKEIKNTVQTRFHVSSMTKPVTAM